MDGEQWALLHPVVGAGSLGLICLLSLPALGQLWTKARLARRNRGAHGSGGYEAISPVFESRDGQATEESEAAFSDRWPRLGAWISLFLGLAASVAAAVLLTIHTGSSPPASETTPWLLTFDNWADVPAWALAAIQCASIPTKLQYDRRFLLATVGFWSSVILLGSLGFRYGYDVVYVLSGRNHESADRRNTALGAAACWLVQILAALAAALSFASFPHRPDVYYDGNLVDQQHASSLLTRFGFNWNRVVFDIANERKLELQDLPNLDGDTRSSCVSAHYVGRGGGVGGKKGRLWWQLIMACKWPLFLQWVLTFVRSVLALFPQFVLYQFLEGLDNHQGGNKAANPRLWGWVIGLGASLMLQVWVNSVQRWLTFSRLEAPLSSLVQSLIFQKALRLDEAAETGQKTADNSDQHKQSGNDKKDGKKTAGKTDDKDAAQTKREGDVRQSVVNHMKLDSNRMMVFCTYNYWFPLALFKLILAGTALARLLGWKALLSGLGCALLVYPISHVMSRKYAVIQFGLMKYRDAKAHVLTEALQGMRQIKYSALEQLYERKILESRNEELKQFWRVAKWMCSLSLIINMGPILLSCVSLSIYTITTPTHVRASVIFASLGLFDQLDEAIGYLPIIQVYLMEAWTSCVRVEKYLNQPDKAPVAVPGDSIVFENATVRWPRVEDLDVKANGEQTTTPSREVSTDVAPAAASETHGDGDNNAVPPADQETRSILRDINLAFPNGELSLVTGKTGSGKSLLLAAILGEVKLVSGSVKVPEAPSASVIDNANIGDENWIMPSLTAFVSQTPWIESGTLKENILFGLPFREARYQHVLQACDLEKDVELLIDGDETEVGPKGVTLSGGQRWRVALARALYSRAGILLFDDVLSAVDAHVGRIIVDQALTGEQLAQGRTRILATHHPEQCLAHAAYLVKLDNGRMKAAERLTHGPDGEPVASSSSSSSSSSGGAAAQAPADRDSNEPQASDGGGLPTNVDASKRTARKMNEEEERQTGRVKSHVYREYIKASNSYFLWVAVILLLILGRLLGVATTWSLKELSGSYPGDTTANGYHFVTQMAEPEWGWQVPTKHPTPPILRPTASQPTDNDDAKYRRSIIFWLCAYVIFDFSNLLLAISQQLLIMFTGLRASRALFARMTHSILHAPLRWADTVPTGRILNRFTSDTFTQGKLAFFLSLSLPSSVSLCLCDAVLTSNCFSSISVSPYIMIFGVTLLFFYGRIASVYIAAAREAKRINSVAHSPVYDQFSSVLTGLSTIRAFHRTGFYMNRMFGLIDNATKANWALQLLARWMNFRMGMFGAVFVTTVAVCIVFGNVEASLAGFGLVFALRYTSALSRLLANVTSIELGFNAAERILEYIEIDTESEGGQDAPAAWPSKGHIEVENLTVKYAADLPPVLKELNFEVRPGERIGVVGRTGAGKSTLAAVFFRLLEPQQGSVRIDGIDIATLKLDQLRSRLAIIPQDPFLFSGTLRSNLDLDGSIDDYDLHSVLERVHLVESQAGGEVAQPPTHDAAIAHTAASAEEVLLLEATGAEPLVADDNTTAADGTAVVASDSATEVGSSIPEEAASSGSTNGNANDDINNFTNLEMPISTGGGNLSQGQRQLVCLARSLLARPKIVVLDEATSAVDRGTDSAIQESLRREFAAGGCTVLVIAHRLSTVADFDRLLVLREGRVAEMGTPRELMERGMALDEQRAAEATTTGGSTEGDAEADADGRSQSTSESPDSGPTGDAGAFWELVKKSAEKDKLMEMVFGKED
ncbi:ABC bile acid transporter [Niveomyces insectorum RCEF 264]|uniref:ABC bile acid transporter n=1 Tax=Niveomyces insectorum RCEF 264 TaxID=1081102 RepID=A0A167MU38_9HYPO|nr:ABC bile acid transporter [Niveomyces insectorum RCEF 264]